MEQPIPVPCAHDKPFWDAAREGRLLLQRSVRTGAVQVYPRGHALDGSGATEWVESRGLGMIETFSVVHRSFYPALAAPYAIVVVRLEEGVKMTGHLIDCAPEEAAIDLPVEVVFRPLTDEISLPCFRPRRG